MVVDLGLPPGRDEDGRSLVIDDGRALKARVHSVAAGQFTLDLPVSIENAMPVSDPIPVVTGLGQQWRLFER